MCTFPTFQRKKNQEKLLVPTFVDVKQDGRNFGFWRRQKRNHRQLVRSRHFFPSSKEEKIYKCQFVAMIVCVFCVFSFSGIIVQLPTLPICSLVVIWASLLRMPDLSFLLPLTFSLDLLPWDWRTGEKPTITTPPPLFSSFHGASRRRQAEKKKERS